MAVNDTAKFPLLVSRERMGNAVGHTLRLYVGRRRQWSVKELSNATGVPDRALECAMLPADNIDWRPLKPEYLASISAFIGSDFTNGWLHLAGQGAFDLPEDDEPMPGQFAADVVGDGAEVARRAADGEFCGEDRQALRVVGQRKMQRGMQLVAMAKRKAA